MDEVAFERNGTVVRLVRRLTVSSSYHER